MGSRPAKENNIENVDYKRHTPRVRRPEVIAYAQTAERVQARQQGHGRPEKFRAYRASHRQVQARQIAMERICIIEVGRYEEGVFVRRDVCRILELDGTRSRSRGRHRRGKWKIWRGRVRCHRGAADGCVGAGIVLLGRPVLRLPARYDRCLRRPHVGNARR